MSSGTFLFASETEKEHSKELRDKMPFRNAFSERSKRSEKECDKRSLHGVPGPCSQVRPFLLAELKKDTPRNFDMQRLIRNVFPNARLEYGPKTSSNHTNSIPLDKTGLQITIGDENIT